MRRTARLVNDGRGARTRFYDGFAFGAERAGIGRIGHRVQGTQRDTWNANIRVAAAAINDRTGADHIRAGALQYLDDLTRASAGGDDVLDHDGGFARLDREAAPQHHGACGIPFRENKARSERAGYLMADD